MTQAAAIIRFQPKSIDLYKIRPLNPCIAIESEANQFLLFDCAWKVGGGYHTLPAISHNSSFQSLTELHKLKGLFFEGEELASR